MNDRRWAHRTDRIGKIRPNIIPDRSSSEKTETDIPARWNRGHILHCSEPCLESFIATGFFNRLDPEQSQVNRNRECVVPSNFLSDGGIQVRGSNRVSAVDLDMMNARRWGCKRRCRTTAARKHDENDADSAVNIHGDDPFTIECGCFLLSTLPSAVVEN